MVGQKTVINTRTEKVKKVFVYSIIDYRESLRKFVNKLFRSNKSIIYSTLAKCIPLHQPQQ